MEKVLIGLLLAIGGYYFTRGLLTIGESIMDFGQANVQGKAINFRDCLKKYWLKTKNWPIIWLEMMF